MRYIQYRSKLLVPVMVLAACVAGLAQTPTFKQGRTPTAAEMQLWNIILDPEGKELPPGNGTAQQGRDIYAQKCAVCHGPNGEGARGGGRDGPRLVGAKNTLRGIRGWLSATTVWDFIHRGMPPVPPAISMNQGGALRADEVYAVTAYLLYRNDIIQESEVMDAKSLPKVPMPKPEDNAPQVHLRAHPAVEAP